MALPPSEVNRLQSIARGLAVQHCIPISKDTQYVIQVAQVDPTAVDEIVNITTDYLNRGIIPTIWLEKALRLLRDLANISDYLRASIAKKISNETIDFHAGGSAETEVANAAQALLEALKVERPKHYFDLCRRILTSNGSIFIIGAGFSFDSYAPLLREMEGIACCTLDDLKVENPRKTYHADEYQAWQTISEGWRIFQKHVYYTLVPKQPSDQHFILAELFHTEHITHIVSFNWDDLVEKAYAELYGESIPLITKEDHTSGHALWKLHGDIASHDERWVLPFEEGRIFKALEQLVSGVTLPAIVVGYREQEPVIREKLISILEKRGGVTRIRPDLPNNPPESFADNAVKAMKTIKASLESAKKSVYPT